VKLYISFDMEGVAGIVDWDQCRPGGLGYPAGCRLLLEEVNAAIDGAIAGGADEIVCNDAHGLMNNVPIDELHGEAVYIAGRHKPLYMMQGMDASVDAVAFVGYHGSISGESAILSHTYNPSVISRATLNGVEVGESGINSLVALAFEAPIVLVTGDRQTATELQPWSPKAQAVVVKESISRYAAANLHPARARAQIAAAARLAVEGMGDVPLPAVSLPLRLDVELQDADMAEVASWVKGVERTDRRHVVIEGDDPLVAYRAFVSLTYITRVASGR
jgi:D-amino peptidase